MPGSTLYYALGDADPRVRGGGINPAALAYAPGAPITINAQTTIKARIRSGTNWSAVVTASFYTTQDFTKLLVSEIMYNPAEIGPTTGDNFDKAEPVVAHPAKKRKTGKSRERAVRRID